MCLKVNVWKCLCVYLLWVIVGVLGGVFTEVAEAQAGSISGKISNSEGEGIAGVHAQAFLDGEWVTNAPRTSGNGEYQIEGLENGSYTVRFWAHETSFVTRWYSLEVENGVDVGQASSVSVSTEEGTGGVDITLLAGGDISGQLVNDIGCYPTLAGIWVLAYDSNEYFRGYALTDETGAFTVNGLPLDGGSMKLYIWDYDGFGVEEWYEDVADFADATPVAVGAPEVITVGFCPRKINMAPIYLMLDVI